VAASSWYVPALGPEGTPAQDKQQHGTSQFSVVRFRAASAKTNNDRKKSTALPKAMIAFNTQPRNLYNTTVLYSTARYSHLKSTKIQSRGAFKWPK
jgi:hypothetical protein